MVVVTAYPREVVTDLVPLYYMGVLPCGEVVWMKTTGREMALRLGEEEAEVVRVYLASVMADYVVCLESY
jgi:hypothetical protein